MDNPFTPATNMVKSFEALKKRAADARLPYDKDVWLNLAFYSDEQYVEWAAEAMTVRRIAREEGQENTPRPVQNKIMHFVAQEHAMALQTKPTVDVLPAGDDPVAVSEASVCAAYLKWMADPHQADFDGELADAVLWALAAGEGWLKWVFDPKAGRGNIISCSPLDLYIDPYPKKYKDARYAIHSQFMDTEQVYDLYDQEVRPQDQQRADLIRTALMREMGQAPVLSGAIVNELWMKPNRRHKDGLFAVWCGDVMLVPPTKFPYAHKQLPFTQIGSIPRPGSSHYTCAVKYLRAPQMELNKYHAQRIAIREAFSNPKWWIDSALELEEDPNDSPRQILRGNSQGGTLKPEIIQPSSMAGPDDGPFIVEEMMHTVGLHEVSQAQVPGRVEAAKAIELLKESDASRQAEIIRTIQNAIGVGFWQELLLAKQFVREELMVQTYSEDGLPEVKRFKGDSVDPAMRVQITMGTGLARSRAAREDQVMTMWQNGIITDPEQAAELLDIPVGVLAPTKAHDIRLARNENFTLADNTAITPNSWDDHAIHLREHNNFRKGHEFLGLEGDVKQKFEHHCDTHETLQLQQLQKQVMLQQIATGQVPPMEPGTAPQGGEQTSPGEQQMNSPQAVAEQRAYTGTRLQQQGP